MFSCSRLGGVLIVLALAGCSRPGAERAPAPGRAAAAGPPLVPITASEILERARHPGARATLVNVWATWCAPCRKEFPDLLRVARARAGQGLRLMLVSADYEDQEPAVRAFLGARAVSDTTYLKTGDDMAFINTLSPKWSGALPATFIYHGGGRLVTFWEGMADEARFRDAVDQALAAHPFQGDSPP
jgi:thiol-disulfide isomerase/thioredoxin